MTDTPGFTSEEWKVYDITIRPTGYFFRRWYWKVSFVVREDVKGGFLVSEGNAFFRYRAADKALKRARWDAAERRGKNTERRYF